MTFQHQDPVTRNPHIRDIEIVLHRTIDEDERNYPEGIEFRITIDDQWGHPMGHRSGDLVPHLTQAQKTALQGFMDAMWTKAETEVIGE
jgi:hypothetical protein